jgi:hypothetical protein
MIRAFTISFDFKGKTYLAFATLLMDKGDTINYTVRVYDDQLSRIIPGGCISCQHDFKKPASITHPSADLLFSSISDSVRCHLQQASLNHA